MGESPSLVMHSEGVEHAKIVGAWYFRLIWGVRYLPTDAWALLRRLYKKNPLRALWYAHLRRIDIDVLWPVCKAKAKDLATAKSVFAVHAMSDAPWLYLGESEISKIIEGLQ